MRREIDHVPMPRRLVSRHHGARLWACEGISGKLNWRTPADEVGRNVIVFPILGRAFDVFISSAVLGRVGVDDASSTLCPTTFRSFEIGDEFSGVET